MHTVTLRLKTLPWQEVMINRRFHALSHLHNTAVSHCKKLLRVLERDKEYQELRTRYTELLRKDKLTAADKKEKAFLSKQMNGIRRDIGLTEHALQSWIIPCRQMYRKQISSQQCQKQMSRVWAGVEKVLFGDGKKLHYKKFYDFNTIGGKSNSNGVIFNKDGNCITWQGLAIPCDMSGTDEYLLEAMDNDLSYCDLKRMMFPNGWHYYVVLVLKGDAPKKLKAAEDAVTGIDLGVSAIAAVSDDSCILEELAPKTKQYAKRIHKLQRQMENSRRLHNPGNYNPDGTVKKGAKTWVYTKSYYKKRNSCKSLNRRKTAYIIQSHNVLADRILEHGRHIVAEEMDFKALQKRSRSKTERSSKTVEINGRTVSRYKRKKRFGRSLNSRAPGRLKETLKRKAMLYGGSYHEVNTRLFRASQYDHVKDDYVKVKLSVREKNIGGHTVQRDLYSAFLLRNADAGLTHPDRDKCACEFENFVAIQTKAIQEMKHNNVSMKQCFGF